MTNNNTEWWSPLPWSSKNLAHLWRYTCVLLNLSQLVVGVKGALIKPRFSCCDQPCGMRNMWRFPSDNLEASLENEKPSLLRAWAIPENANPWNLRASAWRTLLACWDVHCWSYAVYSAHVTPLDHPTWYVVAKDVDTARFIDVLLQIVCQQMVKNEALNF